MTNYYVKNGGNDDLDGLSDENAWATINKVNSFNFQEGNNVFFKCGGIYDVEGITLKIDWSGSDEINRTVIGAYYMSGWNEIIGVNSDGKPVLDAKWDLITYAANATEKHRTIIRPYGANHITIQDLKLINSHGYGILGAPGPAPDYPGECSDVIIRKIYADNIGLSGISIFYMGNNSVVEYCKVIHDNIQWKIGESATWGAGIKIGVNGGICRYNEVGEGYGEGINLMIDSNQIVEYNLVWGRQSVGIYLGGGQTNNTVRNNIVIGTTNTDYHKPWVYGGRTWNPTGIGFNQEVRSTLRNKVYNNVVIGCSTGTQSINMDGNIVGYDNRNYVYNNTFIDNFYNINTHVSELMDTEYKNNISVIHPDAAAIGSKHVWHNSNMGTTYLPLGNFWSSPPELSGWSHPNDIIGDAKLFKTSGWQNISQPNDIDIVASIALTLESDAIGTAQILEEEYSEGITFGSDYNTPDASDINYPIIVQLVKRGI